MKPVVSRFCRTDCTRDNKKVRLPNARHSGFCVTFAKRGFWITSTMMSDEHVGRVVGRVVCEGKVYVEAIMLSTDLQHAFARWIDPETIQSCHRHSPHECMAFMLGAWDEPADIIHASEQGFVKDAVAAYEAAQ